MFQARKDYYQILNVTKNCSAKDIKKSYYELAKKYHPDTNKEDPNAAKKFQEVSEAYEVTSHFFISDFSNEVFKLLIYQVLSDSTKRKEYDTYGATSEQMGMGGGGRGSPGFDQSWQFKSSIDPEELFRKIFGEASFKGGSNYYDDFNESQFGYGAAQEVIHTNFSKSLSCVIVVLTKMRFRLLYI